MKILRERVRKRIGAFAVDSFFNVLTRVAELHPESKPERHGVRRLRDIPYRSTGKPEHLLDIYEPLSPAASRPVVLYIHGGSFRILSKDSHWVMALAFARQGYLVYNVNYRLSPRHRFPAALEDVCDAFAWVVAHAREHGGDLSRLIIAGESAGANLATALTLATAYERSEPWARRVFDAGITPVATIAMCGILQTSDPGRFARRKPEMPSWVSDRIHELSTSYRDHDNPPECGFDLADPLLVLERCEAPKRSLPPFFASVGTRDPLLDDTRRLGLALEQLGVRCDVRYYEGEVHAFQALTFRPAAQASWADTHAFLHDVLGDRSPT